MLSNFNSIKVQLEHIFGKDYWGNGIFQFHKGTIRTRWFCSCCRPGEWFQFHKGTIRTTLHTAWISLERDFNSIKVQLELSKQKSYHSNRLFQFHKGTIRTLLLCYILNLLMYFNSIKVQLERRFATTITLIAKFQFHKGTIRTGWRKPAFERDTNFNSIKVQLELALPYLWKTLAFISIP